MVRMKWRQVYWTLIESYVDSEDVVILLYTYSVQEALFRSTYSLTDSIPILEHHTDLLNFRFQYQSHC